MNIFDKIGLTRSLVAKNITPMWTELQMAIKACVGSYNMLDEGKTHPAVLKDSSDTAVLVSCELGRWPADPMYVLNVVIEVNLIGDAYTINAFVRKWLVHQGSPPKSFVADELRYRLNADPETSEVWFVPEDGKRLTPLGVAEAILLKALYEKPAFGNV
jgi:hypothetical protein